MKVQELIDTMRNDSLTLEEVEIMQMQKVIAALGWQWKEQIYNDGDADNCHIRFTNSGDPTYLTRNGLGDVAWGRFSRHYCWSRAYEYFTKQAVSEVKI